jgi:type IV pilus assembly protein PilM
MPSPFSRNTSESVGLDVDGDFVAAAVVDGNSIGRVASLDLQPGVATDGEVKDPVALGEALKELFGVHKLPKRVRLGVANQQIVVRRLEMPLIQDPEQLDAAVRFQAAEAIAMPLEEAILDYQPIGISEGSDGVTRQQLLVVAARASMIVRLVDAVKAAGLKPEGIDLNAFALVRMLGEPDGEPMADEDTARVICHLGAVTNLAIAQGSLCLFTRPLQTVWTGDDEAAINSLAEEIRLSIDFHMSQGGQTPIGSIVLSGPGGADEHVASELQARTGLAVSVGEPLGRLGTHTIPVQDDPSRYTVAAGLALGATA